MGSSLFLAFVPWPAPVPSFSDVALCDHARAMGRHPGVGFRPLPRAPPICAIVGAVFTSILQKYLGGAFHKIGVSTLKRLASFMPSFMPLFWYTNCIHDIFVTGLLLLCRGVT